MSALAEIPTRKVLFKLTKRTQESEQRYFVYVCGSRWELDGPCVGRGEVSRSDVPPDNNNNDLFCANILEDQAQWRDKTNGLSQLVIVRQCVSRQCMDEDARKLRRIGSIKEIVFRRLRKETILPCDLTLAGSEFHTVCAATEKARVPAFVFTRGM